MRARMVAAAVLLVGVACASPRNGLNTASGACFRALPAAEVTVARKGTLVGVRKVARATLVAKLPQASRITQHDVCAIAFRADYRAGEVAGADPPGPGAFAVVVLDDGGSRVLGAFVVDALPLRFHHRA